MKKGFIVLFVVCVSAALISCGAKAKDVVSAVAAIKNQLADLNVSFSSENGHINPGDFFNPVYDSVVPEEQTRARRVSFNAASGGGRVTVAPGLRQVSNYETKYYTQTSDRDRFASAVLMSEQKDKIGNDTLSNEPFTIVDWGPQQAIPSQVKNPSFYVLFSEPVVPIAALGKPSDTSPYMTVTPVVKGVYRWYGTRLLSFEASEEANPLETYTISVADNISSINGKKLTGEQTLKTTAAELKIIWSQAGYEYAKKNYTWFSQDDVPPEAAKEIRLQFNYAVKADEISRLAKVEAGDVSYKFSLRQDMIDTVTLQLSEEVPPETEVRVSVLQPNKNEETEPAVTSFSTVGPFDLKYYYTNPSSGKYTNPVYMTFSHPVNADSVYNSISVSPDMKISRDNIEVNEKNVVVYGLPVTFNSKYMIKLAKSIRDIYGRNLSAEKKIDVEVPDAESSVRFLNSGAKILEAQFPHRMVFEHQNVLENSFYTLTNTTTPLYDGYYKDNFEIDSVENKTALSRTPKNERVMNVVELDPYLNNGRGIVRFDAKVMLPRKPTRWDPSTSYEARNTTTVQVTDLGVTVRYGINKVVAMVTKLSDGTPVKDANVYFYNYMASDIDSAMDSEISAVTNEKGLAVINLDSDFAYYFFDESGTYTSSVLVEKDGDIVTFRPNDHSPWRSGIYSTGGIKNALDMQTRIFMFSDRYLYKPGETISFRGIDRNQALGSFLPYEGKYKISFRKAWDSKEIINIIGTTSESGGFYGSFVVPENLEPGSYELAYLREGSNWPDRRESINIAYFERVRFQTNISLPTAPVIAGERIQATLAASYLAGGSLAQARYSNSWFQEPWYFAPDGVEFKDYKFGPVNSSENRKYLGNSEGALDGEGRAVLGCDTSVSSEIKGVPYRYRVSADVVDASNQSVSTANAVVVHPASYYIGVSKPQGIAAFPRVGQQLSFDYVLALPDESLLSSQSNANRALTLLAGANANMRVTLTREEWNAVQQQGIGGDIYTRYEKEEVTESKQDVKLAANGKISVTAEKPGYHTLTLSSVDSNGRDVITQYRFFATGSGVVAWNQDDAGEIRLTPDQSQYNPGDTASVLMESVLPKGDYLITVEREGIFTEEVRHFEDGIQVLEIPIAQNYVPVVYVSVSSYSVRKGEPQNEYGIADLDKPKGYYGAAALFINPRVKAFSVQVESAKPSYRPGEEVEITLTATKGGAPLPNAELTLMAVDRGVLDLVNYHVPDPIAFFYDVDNFPLRVYGGDSRAYLMDPVTYEVKNLQGGDSDEDKMNERSDFNPTAIFEPVVMTGADGKVTCKFKLPDTLTTYRITAFGVCGELLALQEDEIVVQNPINVQQVMPRRMRERDTSELGVLLSNLDNAEHEITISLEMQTPAASSIANENGKSQKAGFAKVDGETSHTIKLASGANAVVYFDAVAVNSGVVNAVFTVKSDILNERLVTPLTIEKPYLFETFTTTGQIAKDESSAKEVLIIPGFAADGQGDISVTLDATRLGLLNEAVRYVFDYPYGCMEQQSARVLPFVIFQDYIDVFGLDSNITDVHDLVKSYFASWKNVQHSDGGFGYWANSYNSDLYVSARIAHIYAIALQNGYTTNELAINANALSKYLRQEASQRNTSNYVKAYIYYVLSLMKERVADNLLRAIYSSQNADIATLALTGLAANIQRTSLQDRAAGQTAELCAQRIRSFMRPTTRGVDITSTNVSSSYNQFYEPKTENLALVLQLFMLMNPEDEMNSRLVFELMQSQRSGYWTNTATTARVFEALHTVIKQNNLDATDLTAVAQLNGSNFVQGSFKGVAAKPVTEKKSFSDRQLATIPKDTELPLLFTKNGEGELYYTASLRYALPEEMQSARDEGLGVFMTLYDNATGEEITAKEGSTIVELESGKVYKVAIKLSSSRDRTYVALRAPIPSGAEILDATFVTTSEALGADDFDEDGDYIGSGYDSYSDDYDDYYGYYYGGSHWMSNQTIYDNEVQFFWDSFGRGETTAEFKFRAVRRGVFPTPSVNAECMYEPEIFGRTEGVLYTIK